MLKKSLIIAALFASSQTFAALTDDQISGMPECYTQAELKSGDWILSKASGVVTMPVDYQTCQTFISADGRPLYTGQVYVPYGALYEAYTTAIDDKNGAELVWLSKHTRATKKTLSEFAQLLDVTPPAGWEKHEKLEAVLETEKLPLLKQAGLPDGYHQDMLLAWKTDPSRATVRTWIAMGGELSICDTAVPLNSVQSRVFAYMITTPEFVNGGAYPKSCVED